ncbi:MAG: chromosome segregation protein SMC, partial [candidate division Zixibacteria bacterium]|nr:chromosome segregation protein SMC [candidate division Zixibacteria bacterium]
EAAGITKYKNRKKEALKKLDNTETDLVRLNDIIAEIAKNVRSLKRQASKARRFKTVKDELQQIEIIKTSAQIFDLEKSISHHDETINNRKTEREGLSSNIDQDEASVEGLKLQVAELNEKISSQAAIAADFSEQAIRAENSLSNIQTRLDSGKNNTRLWSDEIETLHRRIETLQSQENDATHQYSQKSDELTILKDEINKAEINALAMKDQLDKSQIDLDSEKEKLHRCDNAIAAEQAKLDAAISSFERLNSLSQNIDQSVSKYTTRMESSQENLQHQKANLNACEQEVASFDTKINANQQEHLSIAALIEEIKKQLSSCEAQRSAARAKLEILSKMVIEHEGYGSGIKALFTWEQRPAGVIDTLANLVTADKEYHMAVEAALNTYGQLVVCKSRQDALVCIDYLRSNESGRVGFLLLDSVGPIDIEAPAIDNDNYIGSIADLINCQDFLMPVVRKLFSDFTVFKSDSIPADLGYKAVDLSGNYYNKIGIIEGGRSSVSLIGRKSELSDLQDAIDTIQTKNETLQNNLAENADKLQRTNDEAVNLRKQKTALLEKRENLLADMTRLDFEFQESVTRLNELNESSSEAGKQTEILNAEKIEIENKIKNEEVEKQEIAEVLFNLSQGHKTLESKFEQATSDLNHGRLKSVELTGLLHKLEEDSKRYQEMIAEARNIIEQKSHMIDDEKKKWDELKEEMTKIRGQLTNIFEAKEKIEADKSGLNNNRIDLVERLNESESKLKQLRADLNKINEAIHQEELKFADYESSIKNIRQTIYHEYGVELTGSKADDYDEEKTDSEIERLKRIADGVGLVNMLADEEYITEKDRLEFLEKQYNDLQEAKTSLLDVIQKINKTAEEKFSETFDLIKENFQNVFGTLFEGGKADILLTNPDDLLDTPIEIIARPGSKKLVSVNQLSGGERALTAISLLFAIYMVKPSPFCILDEIDAPLDDANVTRFIKLVSNFTHSTQFIVITHNKKTMEAADILYGITMEKPGASNIVSVKFNGNN